MTGRPSEPIVMVADLLAKFCEIGTPVDVACGAAAVALFAWQVTVPSVAIARMLEPGGQLSVTRP